MFERYTEHARRVLFFARYEASQLGMRSIETEHLLLGLLRDGEGVTSRVFARAHLSAETVRGEIEKRRTGPREPIPTSVEIPFSAEMKRVLHAAAAESDRLLHDYIGTEHLLLGLLAVPGSVAASILADRGMTLAIVRDDVVRLIGERHHQVVATAAAHGAGSAPPLPDFVPSSAVHIMRSRREPSLRTTNREWVALGHSLRRVVAAAWGVDEARVDVAESLGGARFDVILMLPHDESHASMATRVRRAIEDQLRVAVTPESHATDVFVVTASAGAGAPLEHRTEPPGSGGATAFASFAESATRQGGTGMFPLDRLLLADVTMPMLCATLEDILGRPVIDQTGRHGVFDLELTRPIADRDALVDALRDEAGLTLRLERGHIDGLVVRPR